jgi:uncharacterized lipoprotein YajG
LKNSFFVFLCFLLIPFTLNAKSDSLTFDLEFKPRESVKVHPKNVPAIRIFFESIQDARSNPRTIGENLEDKDQKVTIRASNEPASFVRSVLNREFRSKKFSVEDNAGSAAKIITGTLIKFWTVETSNYDSQTHLKIEVKDRTGRVHYSHTYAGVGKNRGRSLSDTNYNECISNSMTSLIDKLFSDQEFLNALSEKSPPPAEEGNPAVSAAESQPIRTKKTKKRSPPSPAAAPAPTQPVFGPK